jgi:hypothetical protein
VYVFMLPDAFVYLLMISQNVPGKVSFTFDLWTSDPCDPYMSITGHYISAPDEHPTEWELNCKQLTFAPFSGHHSGANQAAVIVKALEDLSISDEKVCRASSSLPTLLTHLIDRMVHR